MVKTNDGKTFSILIEPGDELFRKYLEFSEHLMNEGPSAKLLNDIIANFLSDFPEYNEQIGEQWGGTAQITMHPIEVGILIACAKKDVENFPEAESDEDEEDIPNFSESEDDEDIPEFSEPEDDEDAPEFEETEDEEAESFEERQEPTMPFLVNFHFSSLNMLFRSVETTKNLKGNVYRDGDGFMVPIFIINNQDVREIMRFVEFSDSNEPKGSSFAAYLKEHGKPVCTLDKIRTLNELD